MANKRLLTPEDVMQEFEGLMKDHGYFDPTFIDDMRTRLETFPGHERPYPRND